MPSSGSRRDEDGRQRARFHRQHRTPAAASPAPSRAIGSQSRNQQPLIRGAESSLGGTSPNLHGIPTPKWRTIQNKATNTYIIETSLESGQRFKSLPHQDPLLQKATPLVADRQDPGEASCREAADSSVLNSRLYSAIAVDDVMGLRRPTVDLSTVLNRWKSSRRL